MKKTELMELGLTPEQIKAVQEIHGKDITRERRIAAEGIENASIRTAINGIVSVLEKPESLAKVLRTAKIAHRREVVQKEICESSGTAAEAKEGKPDEQIN